MHKAEILFLNHVSQMSGAEASLVSLLAHLDTGSFRPVVGLPGPGPLSEQLKQLDIEVTFLEHPRLRRSTNPLNLISQYLALRRGTKRIGGFLDGRGADLIHANSLSSAICAARAAEGTVPLIWHVRDLRLPRFATRWVVARTDAIIAISQAVAKAVAAIAPAAADKTSVIHNGVDADAFAPRSSRGKVLQELGLPEDALLVGGVGQLVPWKSWELFLRVGADLAARLSRVHLLIVGADLFDDHPAYREELELLADDLAIGDITHFLGYRTDVADVVSALDVFVHCTEGEPLGRALMEAMSLERPVVAVNAGGPAEIIVDGESGLLAPPRNTYAIADRAAEILRDPQLAGRLGKAARERVRTVFLPEQAARLAEKIYREILWETGTLVGSRLEGF